MASEELKATAKDLPLGKFIGWVIRDLEKDLGDAFDERLQNGVIAYLVHAYHLGIKNFGEAASREIESHEKVLRMLGVPKYFEGQKLRDEGLEWENEG